MPAPSSVLALRAANPWWADLRAPFPFPSPPEYRRTIHAPVSAWLGDSWNRLEIGARVTSRGYLIAGLRRVGKSVLLKQVLESVRSGLVDPTQTVPLTQVAYLNLDDANLRGTVTIADLLEAWQPYRDTKRPAIAVLDEVHHVDESEGKAWHRQLKGLVELENMLVLATGSSASLLREGAAEAPGRWRVVKLEPLSFREFRELRAGGAKHVIEGTRFLDLERYLAVGGFPELMDETAREASEQTKERVRQVLDLEIQRSRQTDKLEQLHRVLVEFSGEHIDIANLCRSLGVSRPTLDAWIDMLEQALLIQRVWRHGSSTLHELRGPPKIYAADPGIVAAFSRVANPTRDPRVQARLQEAAVLRHLRQLAATTGMTLHCVQRERGTRVEGESDFFLRSSEEGFLVEVASQSGLREKAQQQLELAREVARAAKTPVRVVVVHNGPEQVNEPVSLQPLATFLEDAFAERSDDPLASLRSLATELKS